MREYWRNKHRDRTYLFVFASPRRYGIRAPSDISVDISFDGRIKPVMSADAMTMPENKRFLVFH